jgi:transcription initiation factor IIF auxiliary subunit
MTILVRCQAIKDRYGKIKYWIPNGGREHYNVRIWIEGLTSEIDSIEKVTYLLHPSFKNNYRTTGNRDDKFSITIWTWGYFPIEVTLFYKDGRTEGIKSNVTYELPADDGQNYARVDYEQHG